MLAFLTSPSDSKAIKQIAPKVIDCTAEECKEGKIVTSVLSDPRWGSFNNFKILNTVVEMQVWKTYD